MPDDEAQGETETEKDGETSSAKVRYWLTNDIAALSLVGVLCLLMLLGAAGYADVPGAVNGTFAAAAAAAVIWLFGKGAAKQIFGEG